MNLQHLNSRVTRVSTALLLLTSTVLQTVQAADQLVFVLGISRHGARSPQAIMPFNKTAENF